MILNNNNNNKVYCMIGDEEVEYWKNMQLQRRQDKGIIINLSGRRVIPYRSYFQGTHISLISRLWTQFVKIRSVNSQSLIMYMHGLYYNL